MIGKTTILLFVFSFVFCTFSRGADFLLPLAHVSVSDSITNSDTAGSEKTLVASISEDNHRESDKRNSLFGNLGKFFLKVIDKFSDFDTLYVQPQLYDYTFMLINTYDYERYTIKSNSGQSISFSPKPSAKIGPYVGYSILVVGYQFDLDRFSNQSRENFDLRLYTSLFGIDLYSKKCSTDFTIDKASLHNRSTSLTLKDIPFDGLDVSIKGVDLYYIFNHRKFSYPAAFNQTTCQRRSAGSALLGIGYAEQSITLDYDKLGSIFRSEFENKTGSSYSLDPGLMFSKVRYKSYSVSGGYAYNWVFARNFLFAISTSVALAYKQSYSESMDYNGSNRKNFDFKNFNFDALGRLGVVWNTSKWYAGVNTVIHSYTYKKSLFSIDNFFGSLNLYAGFNFDIRLKKKHK